MRMSQMPKVNFFDSSSHLFFLRVNQEKLAPQVLKEQKVVLDQLVCLEQLDPEEMPAQRYDMLVWKTHSQDDWLPIYKTLS